MDCSYARLFLHLGRPGAHDLGRGEADELDAHLGQCASCNQLAADQRRLDERLGRAMRDVPVPPGLREQVLRRLEADRGDRHRRWAGHGLRAFLAAAVLLAGFFAVRALFTPARPVITGDEVVQGFHHFRPGAEGVEEQLKLLGSRVRAPRFVNYEYLVGRPAMSILPGTEDWPKPVKAPQLEFASLTHRAFVYIVSRRQYDVPNLQAPQGYRYDLDIREDPGGEFAYFILHARDKDWEKHRDNGKWEQWLEVKEQ